MSSQDFYTELGVKKDATAAAIKTAYRKLARELHPDRNPGDKSSEERFKRVSSAYQVLSDPKKRKLYDEFGEIGLKEGFDPERQRQYQQWSPGGPGGGGFQWSGNLEDIFGGHGVGGPAQAPAGGIGDIFEAMMGGRAKHRGRAAMPGQDIETQLDIDFMEAIRGAERDLRYQEPGSGKPRQLRVKIPAGIPDGGKLRLKGQGLPGSGGAPSGNLVVQIRIRPHAFYRREGLDLHMDLPITVVEAIEGAKVNVPTPHGDVTLSIPKQSQTGSVLRLRGKGIHKTGGTKGDVYVHLTVHAPDASLSDPALKQLKELLENAYTTSIRDHLKT